MSKKQCFQIVAIFCNVALIVLVCLGVFQLFGGEKTDFQGIGTTIFRYFTVDSNLLLALCALLMLPFNIRTLCRPATNPPVWVLLCKLAGTVAATVTFLTVVFFLNFVVGEPMFDGGNLYLHLICPLLSLLTFLLFERGGRFPLPLSLLGLLPVAAYGYLYCHKVIVVQLDSLKWEDFYHFNDGGKWYISIAVMALGTALLCIGIGALYCTGTHKKPITDKTETSASEPKPQPAPVTVSEVLVALCNGTVQAEQVEPALLRPAATTLAQDILAREKQINAEITQLKSLHDVEEALLRQLVAENQRNLSVSMEQLCRMSEKELQLEEQSEALREIAEQLSDTKAAE